MNETFDAKEVYAAEIEPKVNEVMDLLAKHHIPALFMIAADNINVQVKANLEPDRTPANIHLAISCCMNPEVVVKAMQTIVETAEKIGGKTQDASLKTQDSRK